MHHLEYMYTLDVYCLNCAYIHNYICTHFKYRYTLDAYCITCGYTSLHMHYLEYMYTLYVYCIAGVCIYIPHCRCPHLEYMYTLDVYCITCVYICIITEAPFRVHVYTRCILYNLVGYIYIYTSLHMQPFRGTCIHYMSIV